MWAIYSSIMTPSPPTYYPGLSKTQMPVPIKSAHQVGYQQSAYPQLPLPQSDVNELPGQANKAQVPVPEDEDEYCKFLIGFFIIMLIIAVVGCVFCYQNKVDVGAIRYFR